MLQSSSIPASAFKAHVRQMADEFRRIARSGAGLAARDVEQAAQRLLLIVRNPDEPSSSDDLNSATASAACEIVEVEKLLSGIRRELVLRLCEGRPDPTSVIRRQLAEITERLGTVRAAIEAAS